jgi:hypothetical protein
LRPAIYRANWPTTSGRLKMLINPSPWKSAFDDSAADGDRNRLRAIAGAQLFHSVTSSSRSYRS